MGAGEKMRRIVKIFFDAASLVSFRLYVDESRVVLSGQWQIKIKQTQKGDEKDRNRIFIGWFGIDGSFEAWSDSRVQSIFRIATEGIG